MQSISTDLLDGLSPAQSESLLQMGSRKILAKREFIFEAGMPSEHVYIILDGRAKIFELSSQGTEVIMWFCFPGEVFGLAEVWLGSQRDVFAQACSDMQILEIPRIQFREYLMRNPETAMLVIDVLAGRLRVLSDMILNLTAIDVSSRLIKLLSRLFLRYGRVQGKIVYLDMPLTHQEMADMIGSCRQTVTQTLGRLKEDCGLIVERCKLSVPAPDVEQAAKSLARFLQEV